MINNYTHIVCDIELIVSIRIIVVIVVVSRSTNNAKYTGTNQGKIYGYVYIYI